MSFERKSLIERAAEVYDFGAALGPEALAPIAGQASPEAEAVATPPARPRAAQPVIPPAPADAAARRCHAIDRAALRAAGFIDPAASATSLSEEFRIIKRQLLAHCFAPGASPADRLVLISSAHPGDGKSWIAINLALSLSAESDIEVLLVDGDFGKPSVCATLGVPPTPGLLDALADPALSLEGMILATDIPSLSVLPSGTPVHNDTEILAAGRTQALLDALVRAHPRRIVLFDSSPALAASAASELAAHVGLTLMVVRADRTSELALRDAVQLVSACPAIKAILNGVKFSSSGRLFGAYYGKGKG